MSEKQHQLRYKIVDPEAQCVLRQVYTVKINQCKYVFFIFFTGVFVGISLLLIHWYPKLRKILYYDNCKLQQSTHVSVVNEDEELSICLITEEVVMLDEAHKIKCRVFIKRYLKYFIDEEGNIRAKNHQYSQQVIKRNKFSNLDNHMEWVL